MTRVKPFICLVVFLAATAPARIAGAAEQDIRSCDFEIKGRCVAGEAHVTLAGGVVKRLEVTVIWCGRRDHPAYICSIDSTRGEADAVWSEDGDATVIANTSPFNPHEPDRVKLTVGRQVSIDLHDTQSLGRCGAGAALPLTVVIPARKGACRVRLP